jgi:hypothetical protein
MQWAAYTKNHEFPSLCALAHILIPFSGVNLRYSQWQQRSDAALGARMPLCTCFNIFHANITGGCMSTVLNTSRTRSLAPVKQVRIQNPEGNWNEYLRRSARRRDADKLYLDRAEFLADSRDCALAYLGKRAQFNGGVGSKLTPRILTPQMIADLEASNRAKRYSLYPWMETLANLSAEIERIQDEIAHPINVFSLLPATTYYRNTLCQDMPGTNSTALSRISIRSRAARKLPR